MYDLHVVGGGPAGCFAGIAAAQEGKKVLLSEEHKCIGKPEACSGLISKSGLDTLLPHINYKSVRLNTITSAKIISGKQHFTIRPKNEEAVLVSRSGLDSLSAAKFEQEGGKIELGKKVTRNFASSNIVGADGPASALAEYFGFPKILSFVACMQGNFAYSCESPHQTEIHLSSKDFPGFFGWAIPINNEEAKIGVGVSLPIHPLRHYRRFLSKLGVKGNPRNEFAAIIPTSTRSITGKKAGKYNVVLA
jgi:flavin-dependent dehydrogenase